MRKIIAAAFVSLDGVMQAPGGPTEDPSGGFKYGGWTFNYWDESMGQFMGEMFSTPYDLLLGRKTYEIFAAHWPFVEPSDPVGQAFNAVTKYVATSSTEPLSWINSVALNGDVVAAIAQLKQQEGPALLTQGSSVLLHTLLAHDLIDQLRLLTFPVILGSGKRWFDQSAKPGALKLSSNATSSNGVIMSVYDRAGDVTMGSFALAQASEAEIARQARMKREG